MYGFWFCFFYFLKRTNEILGNVAKEELEIMKSIQDVKMQLTGLAKESQAGFNFDDVEKYFLEGEHSFLESLFIRKVILKCIKIIGY
jgi:hypothetical protein